MAIETLLKELNETMQELIATLGGMAKPQAGDADDPAPKKRAPAKKKAPAKKAPAKKTGGRKKKLTYDGDVKPQVLIAISTPEGREDVKELLEEYEVKKATDLDADDWPEFLKGIEEIIEKYDDDDDE